MSDTTEATTDGRLSDICKACTAVGRITFWAGLYLAKYLGKTLKNYAATPHSTKTGEMCVVLRRCPCCDPGKFKHRVETLEGAAAELHARILYGERVSLEVFVLDARGEVVAGFVPPGREVEKAS